MEVMNCSGSEKPYISRMLYWAGPNWYGVVDGSTLNTERGYKKVKGRCPLCLRKETGKQVLEQSGKKKIGKEKILIKHIHERDRNLLKNKKAVHRIFLEILEDISTK